MADYPDCGFPDCGYPNCGFPDCAGFSNPPSADEVEAKDDSPEEEDT